MKTLSFFLGGLAVALLASVGISLAAATVSAKDGAVSDRISVYFPPGEARLTPEAEDILDETADRASEAHAIRVVVVGYDGGSMSEADRARIASERAQIVELGLLKRGISPNLLYVMAAAARPQANYPAPAFIADRRAEVVIEHGAPGY